MDNRPIGIFDSGIGGMTVYCQLKKILPNESYVYLADTLNNPYGDKTVKELNMLVDSNIEFLLSKGVKAIAVACNTASTLNLKSKSLKYNIPIYNVLQAGVNSVSSEKRILIAATKATVESGRYKEKINEIYPEINIYQVACPKIAPSIEFEDLDDRDIQNIVDGYIKEYCYKQIDSLIMGCTHYPIWEKYFLKSLPHVKIIDPAEKMAQSLKESLEYKGLLNEESKKESQDDIIYVTGDQKILSKKIKNIFSIDIKICKKS